MDFSLFSPPSRVSSTILSSTKHPVIQSVAKDLGNIHVYILALCSRDSSLRSDELLRTCPKNDKKKPLPPLKRGEFQNARTCQFVGIYSNFSLKERKDGTICRVFTKKWLTLQFVRMTLNRSYIIILLCSLWVALPLVSMKAQGRNFTIVIDPGHGGRDPGAIGKRGKEKNINLNVALKLGKLIEANCKDVRIVYTRDKDTFVALDKRAQIANNAKADLFISIHTNAVAKGRIVRGTETYTLGLHKTDENLEVAKLENSVILIESDYEQRYAGFNPNSAESYIIFEFLQDRNMEKSVQLATQIQRQFKNTAKRIDKGVHQAGFLVLRETTMPGVLVELGYISTPDEERYLLSEAGTDALARSIYQAFMKYRGQSYTTLAKNNVVAPIKQEKPASKSQGKSQTKPQAQKKPAASAQKSTSGKPVFKIQILTSDKKLASNNKQFKGLSPVEYFQEKGIYKYTYGASTDYNKVLRTKKQISAKFKGAFIIAFKDGKKMDVNQAIKEFKNNNK